MAAPALQCQDRAMEKDDKAERLAAALRENLRKRKAQARSLPDRNPAPPPPPSED